MSKEFNLGEHKVTTLEYKCLVCGRIEDITETKTFKCGGCGATDGRLYRMQTESVNQPSSPVVERRTF